MPLPPAIFLMGPTAAGKTELALELVKNLPVAIISVDSTMVYRGMDIGSSKPARRLRQAVPHRLIDILDPAESYSAARFREDALREMASITAAGQIPLLVGGTGLYFRALERGLAPLPDANPAVRCRISQEAKIGGWGMLHARLATLDPPLAARIHPNDPQRIQRALEIIELTGRPITEIFAATTAARLPYRVLKLAVSPGERAILHQRIATRFSRMLAEGLVSEVELLYNRPDLGLHCPAVRAVGYRQIWEYLAGKLDYLTMQDQAIVATRQLARRQLTWLRTESAVQWINTQAPDYTKQALQYCSSHLINSEYHNYE